MKTLLAALTAIAITSTASAAPPTGPVAKGGVVAPPSGARLVNVACDGSRWYVNDSENRFWYLYHPTTGCYDRKTRSYARFDGSGFEKWDNGHPPAELPAEAAKPWVSTPSTTGAALDLPTGVDLESIGSGPPTYRVGGKEVSKTEAYEMIEKAAIPDLTNKRRITIIGSVAECNKALSMLPANVTDFAVVKRYAPDDWYVREKGFVTNGTPVVYCQAPDGTVLHRQDNLDGLAAAAAKMDPKYDPSKDPDLRLNTSSTMTLAIIAAVFIAGGLTFRFGPPIVRAARDRWNYARDEQLRILQEQRAQSEAQFAAMASALERQGNALQVLANRIPDKEKP